MNLVVITVFVLAPVGLLLYILWQIYYEGRKHVNPTEWIVMQNGLTGALDARPPGTHSFGPEWQERVRIRTNREQIKVLNEEVRSAAGTRLSISYRYGIVLGRKYREIQGHPDWFEFDGDPLDFRNVDRQQVINAATLILEGQAKDRIAQALETAVEQSVGLLPDEVALTPKDVKVAEQPKLPEKFSPGIPLSIRGVTDVKVDSSGKLYEVLSFWIPLLANASLFRYGIGLNDFHVTNLRYFSEEMQKALEEPRRKALLGKATKELQTTLQAQPGELTTREALAAGTDAFGPVAQAEAIRAIAKGMEALATVHDLIRITGNTIRIGK